MPPTRRLPLRDRRWHAQGHHRRRHAVDDVGDVGAAGPVALRRADYMEPAPRDRDIGEAIVRDTAPEPRLGEGAGRRVELEDDAVRAASGVAPGRADREESAVDEGDAVEDVLGPAAVIRPGPDDVAV